jgi:hypothetical protein
VSAVRLLQRIDRMLLSTKELNPQPRWQICCRARLLPILSHLARHALVQSQLQEPLRVLDLAQQPRDPVGDQVDDLDAQQGRVQEEAARLVEEDARGGGVVAWVGRSVGRSVGWLVGGGCWCCWWWWWCSGGDIDLWQYRPQ